MSEKLKIVTHNAGFHTDDVFAVATLSLILEKEGKEFTITRSRDLEIAGKADFLLDFGGIDDPNINRFDHHQEGGAGKRENGVPFASFGLVWKKYGAQLAGSEKAANKIDQVLVQPIDALDNGVAISDSKIEGVSNYDVGSVVHMFYPTWKEDPNDVDANFLKMVDFAKFILGRIVTSIKDSIEAEEIVVDIYNKSEDKRLIVVEDNRYPWNEVLTRYPEPLFAVYKNITGGTWSIKGLRDDYKSFVYRKNLPKAWAGKRDEELEKVTGVKGATFCHNHIFMAVAKTKEAILEMAKIALENTEN